MPGVFGNLELRRVKAFHNNIEQKMVERLKHDEEWFDDYIFRHEFGFHGLVELKSCFEGSYGYSRDNEAEVIIFGHPFLKL